MEFERDIYLSKICFAVTPTDDADKPFNVEVFAGGTRLVGDFYPTVEEGLANLVDIVQKTADQLFAEVKAYTWDEAVAIVEGAA